MGYGVQYRYLHLGCGGEYCVVNSKLHLGTSFNAAMYKAFSIVGMVVNTLRYMNISIVIKTAVNKAFLSG